MEMHHQHHQHHQHRNLFSDYISEKEFYYNNTVVNPLEPLHGCDVT